MTDMQAWESRGKQLAQQYRDNSWRVADWLLQGQDELHIKDVYDIGERLFGLQCGTLKTYASVARSFPSSTRVDGLSLLHHRHVVRVKNANDQQALLHKAVKQQLSASELQAVVYKFRIGKPAPLPRDVYRVIYADPPWFYSDGPMTQYVGCRYGKAQDHYPTMRTADICALTLPKIADNAVLFLWTTAPMARDAFEVIDAWRFKYTGAEFVWDKIKHNIGHYNSVRHERLLIATRGSCPKDSRELDDSVVSILRTEHSRKPEQFRKLIDKMYPKGRRIELFARGITPDGWSSWGNESCSSDDDQADDGGTKETIIILLLVTRLGTRHSLPVIVRVRQLTTDEHSGNPSGGG